jgi:hypothetical protein
MIALFDFDFDSDPDSDFDPDLSMSINQTKDKRPSLQEKRLSILLLGVLMLIVAAMLWLQSRYDPASWRLQPQPTNEPGVDRPKDAFHAMGDHFVPGLEALSPTENYQPDTLSDKIDGKAELYLAAGFRRLHSQRFGLAGQSEKWMEWFIYDMGQLRGAFAVFSAQRRSNIDPLGLTPYAYQASNGLFFVHGRYYVEIIAAEVDPQLQAQMEALARSFVASWQPDTQPLEELSRFPSDGLVPHSQALIANSAFGLDRLDWIFTARYEDGKAEATAFVSQRSSAQNAAELADAFHRYWMDYGGEELVAPASLPDARMVNILDSYEIVMVHGAYLIGVHEASSLAFGVDLTVRLKRMIEEPSQ